MERLNRRVHLEIRAHDSMVLKSYITFLKTSCEHLRLEIESVETAIPYLRWIQPCLRAKFAAKKYKLHYETRTYINRMTVARVTGSTAECWLEYVQRQIPEGVAMKVTREEMISVPVDMLMHAKETTREEKNAPVHRQGAEEMP